MAQADLSCDTYIYHLLRIYNLRIEKIQCENVNFGFMALVFGFFCKREDRLQLWW